jgi:hypothetical protein
MLKVGVLKGARYDVEGHQGQKCVGNITSTSVKNISYFFELRVIWKHGKKDNWGYWKDPQNLFLHNKGCQNKHHGCLKY